MTDKPLRIAVIGSRGLPATYGGVERHVEEIGARLADRGHEVTVFCRRGYGEPTSPSHRGMRLICHSSVDHKNLETIVHSARASFSTLGRHFDLVAYHAIGPGLLAPVPRYLGRTPVVQTIHGLDADRAKWGTLGRRALQAGSWLSAHVPDATIVVSQALGEHYLERYRRPSHHIPNGVTAVPPPPPGATLERWGLTSGCYALFVGRLVPEKAPDRLVRAFLRTAPSEVQLVLAGGSSFTDDYVRGLHELVDGNPRVVLPGFVYGQDLQELYANAGLFVLPSDLEGLPLTLLEAASFGVPVLASDIPPHVEVLRQSGPGRRLVRAGDETALATGLEQALLADPVAERAGAAALRADVLERYSWDRAAADTEAVYRSVVAAR